MAYMCRYARSSYEWSRNELQAYHITITHISPEEFFLQRANPPVTDLDPALVNTPLGVDDRNVSDDTCRFLSYLDLATNAGEDTAIDDFARELLHTVGYDERGYLLRTGHTVPLPICGSDREASIGVCLLDRQSTILLVLQTDKKNPDPEPQVIAGAIAAYEYNNKKRDRRGLTMLSNMIIPCITMTGTRPTFYLVPVTKELSDGVASGQWPGLETKVLKCVTVVAHNRRPNEGMETPGYRKVALQRLRAFGSLAERYWREFVVEDP